MGFDGQAFATAFLNSLTGGIQERQKKAQEFGERERERAKRSMKVYKERKMKMNPAQGYASAIRKALGSDQPDFNADEANRAIMFYAKDGLPALQSLYGIIQKQQLKTLDNPNVEFGPAEVKALMDIPEQFKTGDVKMEDFWKQTFNLAQEHDSVQKPDSTEANMGNLFMGAMGINAKERMKRKLETEKYLGNISVAELNRMAEDDDYRNIFGEGTFQVATPSIASLPKVLSDSKVRQITDQYFRLTQDYKKKAYFNDFMKTKNLNTQQESIVLAQLNKGSGKFYSEFIDWAEGMAKDTITDIHYSEGIPEYVKNQLPFLKDAKVQEESEEQEAENITKTVDSAVQATNVLETEFGEPIELTKEEDISSDNEFVYFYSFEIDKFRGKAASKRLLRVKASQAHLINEYVKKKGLSDVMISTTIDPLEEHMGKIHNKTTQEMLKAGKGYTIQDVDLSKEFTQDNTPANYDATFDGGEFVGVTVKNNQIIPVYKKGDKTFNIAPTIDPAAFEKLRRFIRQNEGKVGGEERIAQALQEFKDKFGRNPTEQELKIDTR
jgi:hypothetical protein